MMVVLLAGGALGFSGFQLRRKVGVTTTQTATAAHIDFWPGFRDSGSILGQGSKENDQISGQTPKF